MIALWTQRLAKLQPALQLGILSRCTFVGMIVRYGISTISAFEATRDCEVSSTKSKIGICGHEYATGRFWGSPGLQKKCCKDTYAILHEGDGVAMPQGFWAITVSLCSKTISDTFRL